MNCGVMNGVRVNGDHVNCGVMNGDRVNGDHVNGDRVKFHQNEQSQILNLNILFYILNIYF